jgi:hypothetical protein
METPIDHTDFSRLCRDASTRLQLPDSDAMGGGDVVVIDELDVQLTFDHARSCGQFYCDLGDPKPDAAPQVYEKLLELQSMFIGNLDAMFVRDPVNDRLLFTVSIPLEQHTPDSFCTALTTLTGQVRLWQSTLLAGVMIDYEAELAKLLGNEPAPDASQFA